MKTPHARDEVDAEFDRMKWLHMARKASAKGIGDIAAPPGGWPGAAPSMPKHETPPARVRAGAPPVRYAEQTLPPELVLRHNQWVHSAHGGSSAILPLHRDLLATG